MSDVIENRREVQRASVKEASWSLSKAAFSTIGVLKGHLESGLRNYYEGVLENLNGARGYLTKKGLLITTELAIAFSALTACAPEVNRPVATPSGNQTGAIATETQNPTGTPTTPATQEASPTPEAKDVWVYSKDGRIYYNEKELGDGLFAINEANTESYYESMLKGIWTFNKLVYDEAYQWRADDTIQQQGKRFLKRFPTAEDFIKYVKGGGAPVTLYLPENENSSRNYGYMTMRLEKDVDLSAIAIGIEVRDPATMPDQVTGGSKPEYAASPWIEFEGQCGMFIMLITKTTDGKNIIEVKVTKDLKVKDPYLGRLPLYKGMDPNIAIKSANQLLMEVPEGLIEGFTMGPEGKGLMFGTGHFNKDEQTKFAETTESPVILR